MHVALGRQDRLAAGVAELRVLHTAELGDETGGTVPALVAQDRHDVVVVGDGVTDHALGQPVHGPGVGDAAHPGVAVEIGREVDPG